jgi:hypothetical protein
MAIEAIIYKLEKLMKRYLTNLKHGMKKIKNKKTNYITLKNG